MNDSVLFLHGTYDDEHIPFYKKLCRNVVKIAVDGGYEFFRKADVVPDMLFGDFDSIKLPREKLPEQIEVMAYPKDKDKTDGHLALAYCLDKKSEHIDIVQPDFGEPDQFVGNLMLLNLPRRARNRDYRPKVRIINAWYEVTLVDNAVHAILGGVGDRVSVIPLSHRVSFSCEGTKFDAKNAIMLTGETLAMRNIVAADEAVFKISGQVLLMRQFTEARQG